MAGPGRVQAPELNLRPSLSPAPVVNVVGVAPVNRQGAGSNLLQIAESLSGLSSSFSSFAQSQKASAKAAKGAQGEVDANWIKAHKYHSSESLVTNPDLPRTPEAQVLVGDRKATEVGDQLWQYTLDNYDPETSGPYPQWLQAHVAEVQSGMAPAEAAGFGAGIQPTFDGLVKKYGDTVVERNKSFLEGNTFNHLLSIGERYKDLPANERAEKMKTEGLNEYRSLMFATGKESNDLLLKTIKYYADNGNTEMVTALSTMPRGTKGEIPALYDNPDYRESIDAATAAGDKKWVELNNAKKQDFNDQQEEILKSGDMTALQKLYETHEYTKRLPDGVRNTDFNSAREKLKTNIITNTSKSQVATEEELLTGKVQLNFDSGVSGQVYEDKTIVTKDGKEVTIKGSDVAQKATDTHIKNKYDAAVKADEEAVAKGKEPTALISMDAEVARKAAYSPAKVTAWENTNDTALTQLNALALEQGQMTPNIDRAYKLWLNTRDNREVYLAKGGKNAEKLDTMFSAAQVLIEGGQEPTNALAAVARSEPNTKRVGDRIADAVRARPDLDQERNTLPVKVAAAADYETRILVSNNVDPVVAMEKVNKKYKERVVEIDAGGSLTSKITYPTGMTDPTERQKFVTGITNILQYNKDAAPGQDRPVDPDSLSVVDNGDGTYSITEDGLPTPAFLRHKGGDMSEQGVNRFTLEDVDRELQFIDRQNQVDVKKNEVDPMAGTQDSAFVAGVKEVGSLLTGGSKPATPTPPKKDESILKGLTDVPEKAYGATTVNDIHKLTDRQLRELMTLDKQGKLETKGFVNSKTIKEVYDYRVRKATTELGYTAEDGSVEEVNKKLQKRGWKDAIQFSEFLKANEDGYTREQVQAAMTRWSTDDPAEAIRLLKKNNAKPDNQ